MLDLFNGPPDWGPWPKTVINETDLGRGQEVRIQPNSLACEKFSVWSVQCSNFIQIDLANTPYFGLDRLNNCLTNCLADGLYLGLSGLARSRGKVCVRSNQWLYLCAVGLSATQVGSTNTGLGPFNDILGISIYSMLNLFILCNYGHILVF